MKEGLAILLLIVRVYALIALIIIGGTCVARMLYALLLEISL